MALTDAAWTPSSTIKMCGHIILLSVALWWTCSTAETNKVLLAYYPNWAASRSGSARFLPEQINPNLCTHLTYAYAKLDEKELVIAAQNPTLDLPSARGPGLYQRCTALKKKNPYLKVILAMGGFFDSSDTTTKGSKGSKTNKYSLMVGSARSRAKFIAHVIHFLKQFGFDGLEVHWETPTADDKANFALFVQECKTEFRTHRLLLFLTVSVLESVVQKVYDVNAIQRYVDHVSLMTFDYHGFYEGVVQLLSPLFPVREAKQNVDASVKLWLRLGMPANKIVIGVALYAKTYTLMHPSRNVPGSVATGPGLDGPQTHTEGYLAYYETCNEDFIKAQESSGRYGPYSYQTDQWLSYNDKRAVATKCEYVIKEGLRGVAMWSIEQDDFSGTYCSEGGFPLVSAAKAVLDRVSANTSSSSTRPSKTSGSTVFTDRCTVEGYFPVPTKCTHFYQCESGRLETFSCNNGMFWNQRTLSCGVSKAHCAYAE